MKVGSFVKLFRDQPVPADLLLVYTTSGQALKLKQYSLMISLI